MNFADALKRFRKENKLTQKQVADAIGIQTNAYQTYEYGKSLPSIAVVMKIADYFGVTTDYLLGRTDEPNLENWIKSVNVNNVIVEQLRQAGYSAVDQKLQEMFPNATFHGS